MAYDGGQPGGPVKQLRVILNAPLIPGTLRSMKRFEMLRHCPDHALVDSPLGYSLVIHHG